MKQGAKKPHRVVKALMWQLFFFFYEATAKCNRTLMGLLKKKHSSIKFNYPRMLRMKKKKILCKRSIKPQALFFSLQPASCRVCTHGRRWIGDNISGIDQSGHLTLTGKGQILHELQRWLTLTAVLALINNKENSLVPLLFAKWLLCSFFVG